MTVSDTWRRTSCGPDRPGRESSLTPYSVTPRHGAGA